jgi:Flp pilus assembly protein TadG
MALVARDGFGTRASRRAKAATQHFVRNEDGALIWFTLVLFILMVIMGGMAVDLMRYERTRVTLQQTIDRATLAAASLDQPLDAEDVVNDYFAKAGLADKLQNVSLDEGINFKVVTADASALSQNYFMDWIGYADFSAPAHSVAEQRITNVEVVLVLDVSGSMGGNNKLTNLKVAAADFVDLILERDVDDRISISIVPYNAHVNLGPDLMNKYQVTNRHNRANSFCIDLPEAAGNTTFTNLVVPRNVNYPQAPHADAMSGYSNTNNYVAIQGPQVYSNGLFPLVRCQPNANTYVRMPNNDAATLKAQINALQANGNTSIDLGMRWGVSMIDPSFRGIVSEEVTAGRVPEAFSGRPFNYDDPDAMKVIVLMTDGEHVTSEYFQTAYRGSALSPIYRRPDGLLVIKHGVGAEPFWAPFINTDTDSTLEGDWMAGPYDDVNAAIGVEETEGDSTVVVQRLTWQQVWSMARVQWVAWQLYARALGTDSTTRASQYTATMNTFLVNPNISTTARDTRLDQLCELVKAQGVLVYGIAFEAPTRGQNVIRGCASQPSSTYYFDARGLQIRTAFRLIASNISQLRLTQ